MKKYIILTATLLMSLSSYADSRLIGGWCGLTEGQIQGTYVRTTDFTEVLSIDAKGDLKIATVGNEAGEMVSFQRGFLSIGATKIHMELGGEKIGVDDYKLTRNMLNGKRRLKIKYSDGGIDRYQECSVTWKKRK